MELVGIYIDQIGSQGVDIGVPLAEQHGVPVYPSIRQALCCGGDRLAVDGVLMIGEHGVRAPLTSCVFLPKRS